MRRTASTKLPIRVTERDRELLRLVSSYRLLSTEHIRYLLYPSMNRARKRVLQLFRHGLLSRFTRPVRLGEGSSQYLYTPSRKGMSVISDQSAAMSRRPRRMTELHGEHALRTNDFRIALELAQRMRDDFTMSFWKPDRELKLSVSMNVRQRTIHVPVVPDGFFGLRIQDKAFFYMLEVDRATAPLTRIRTKLEAYSCVWQSRALLAQLKIPTFRLLWITSGQQRLQHLLKLVRELNPKHPRTDIVFLTSQDHVRLERPEHVLGKVWQIVHRAEILPVSPFPTIPFERSRSHQVNHQCANQTPELAKGEHGPGG